MRSITDDCLTEITSNRVRPALFAKLTFAPPTDTTIYEDNVLLNGGFESEGGTFGADWTPGITDNTKITGLRQVNSGYQHGGTCCLLLRVQEGVTFTQEEYARAFSGLYPVTPGDVLKLGGYITAASNGGATVPANSTITIRVGVLFLDATQTYIGDGEVSAGDVSYTAGQTVSMDWTNKETTTTVPSGAAYVQFECSLFFIPDSGHTVTTSNSGLTADVRFDDCYIQKQYNPDVRLWTGIGDIAYGGYIWKGVGTLGSISPIIETTETQAQGITLQLSGIPTDLLAASQEYLNSGSTAEVHLGFLDSSGSLIDTPISVYMGLMDQVSIEIGTDTSTITVAVENKLSQLQRARGTLLTDQDQRSRHPSDGGLKYVSQLADKLVVWGG